MKIPIRKHAMLQLIGSHGNLTSMPYRDAYQKTHDWIDRQTDQASADICKQQLTDAAKNIGRAMHTLQDEASHRYITFPDHLVTNTPGELFRMLSDILFGGCGTTTPYDADAVYKSAPFAQGFGIFMGP